jgi:PAS domain S-box-containing protein
MAHFPAPKMLKSLQVRAVTKYAFELLVVGAIYFALAKLDLALSVIHPSTLPIAPAPGFALATILLRGVRIWPAIFAAALAAKAPIAIADATLADSVVILSIAAAATLEGVIAGYLINIWSDGRATFETPAGAAKFTIVSLGPSAIIGASVAVGAAYLVGSATWVEFIPPWITWWLRDASGLLVITPVIVLWATNDFRAFDPEKSLLGKNWTSGTAFFAAGVLGLVAFSPLLELPVNRSALAIVAVSPLLWAALRCSQRDTVVCTLIFSAFAVWGAWPANGPFGKTPNETFLISTIIVISASVLGLILSADIAQRRRVKAKLFLQEQNLRGLLSHADVGIAQMDTMGRFKLVNSRYCDIVRRPAAELLQLRIQDLLQVDDSSQIPDALGQAVRTGDAFAIENKIVPPDGAPLWVKSNVAPIVDQTNALHYLVAVAEDITARREADDNLAREHQKLLETIDERTATLSKTREALDSEIAHRKRVEDALRRDIAERRKTQEALLESEWRFQTVIQGISDYAIFMLDRDGCITNWNVGAQRIHQYAAEEVVGRHFSRFYSEEEQQAGEPARTLQVAAYEGKYAFDGWRVRRDNSKFWATVVIEAIRDEAGTLAGFVHITRDITERREAQISLERAQEQLSQSQKMEALGQLTGSIAHDFNNLLMIVSGHAQLLRRRLSDPKHLQAIDAVNSAANRGESLTRQLLAFSRRQPINPIVTDLKERIEAVHEMLVGSLRGNIHLKCEIPADVWPVEVDIAELELALVNIAVNARDAMPGGGVITLSATNVTLQKSDRVDQLEGEFVALAMSDTGVGIAPDVLPRIFEPFFTTKPLGKGTGLGLSQVYGFSQQSGGAVVATSTVGKGTAITIYLPRKHATLVKAKEVPSSPSIVPSEGTVLMVEDNPDVADVTASLVEQLGYRVVRSNNAMDALSRLQRGEKIMLVFSDIVMPGGMNGIALAQEIRNRYPRLPVLLTSGYSDVAPTATSQFRILRKPFQLHALEKAMRETLEFARTRDTDDRVVQFPSTSTRHGPGGMSAT